MGDFEMTAKEQSEKDLIASGDWTVPEMRILTGVRLPGWNVCRSEHFAPETRYRGWKEGWKYSLVSDSLEGLIERCLAVERTHLERGEYNLTINLSDPKLATVR